LMNLQKRTVRSVSIHYGTHLMPSVVVVLINW
jgi:hypothetical protein